MRLGWWWTRHIAYCSWPLRALPQSMLDVWNSVIVIDRLVYELLLLSYCYTCMWCLMKCVRECDLDWISKLCAWILSYPAATGELTSAPRCCCTTSSDVWADVRNHCWWPSQKQRAVRPLLLHSTIAMDRWYQVARRYWQSSRNGPLMLDSLSLLCGPIAMGHWCQNACCYCGGQ
jgi:hypothetical protein